MPVCARRRKLLLQGQRRAYLHEGSKFGAITCATYQCDTRNNSRPDALCAGKQHEHDSYLGRRIIPRKTHALLQQQQIMYDGTTPITVVAMLRVADQQHWQNAFPCWKPLLHPPVVHC